MLQQTQVSSVIPFYNRFMARFPNLKSLAEAPVDEVMHQWSGLGYYARARNLHKAAKQIMEQYGGRFPNDIEQVTALPGVGRSTAGAILAFGFQQRYPILDGNVKRVLTRIHRIGGYPGKREVEKRLWGLAESYTPNERVAEYTQAIMDLGAELCVRKTPKCKLCPVTTLCAAHRHNDVGAYPCPKPKKVKPEKQIKMLLLRRPEGEILLTQRPPTGIWGGLWSFPECSLKQDVIEWCEEHLGIKANSDAPWPILKHSFTHFNLHITPHPLWVDEEGLKVMENSNAIWYNPKFPDARGLAAPVTRLLQQLR